MAKGPDKVKIDFNKFNESKVGDKDRDENESKVNQDENKQKQQEKRSEQEHEQEKLPYDEKGHYPVSNDVVEGSMTSEGEPLQPGVKKSQILDKGTEVQVPQKEENKTSLFEDQDQDQDKDNLSQVPVQIARAGRPTRADTPDCPDPAILVKTPKQTPQDLYKTQNEKRKSSLEEIKLEEKYTPLKDDPSTYDSRSGSILENPAERGDKVHHITPSGALRLEVQSHDKSNSRSLIKSHTIESGKDKKVLIHRRKVSLLFPGINSDVSAKELSIYVTEFVPKYKEKDKKDKSKDESNNEVEIERKDYSPSTFVLTPDVPNLEVLLPESSKVHVELSHISKEGHRSHPYILDFYCDPRADLKPLEASPIGYEIMESVTTYAE